jgi:prepilin-type N-terminal cleavage/methylation domain-containing protein
MRNRRGYSLVECLVAMTVVSAVFAPVTLLVHALYRAESRVRDAVAGDRELDRLAVQLRQDAHQALSATVGGGSGPRELTFRWPEEQTAQYTLSPGQIERVVRQGEVVLHREGYAAPPSAAMHWEIQAGHALPLVALRIDVSATDSRDGLPSGICRVEAVVRLLGPRFSKPKP